MCKMNLTTVLSVMQVSNESLKSIAVDMREGNKVATTLSRVLKDMQRKDTLLFYAPCFGYYGLPQNGKVTAKMFFEALTEEQYVEVEVKDKNTGEKKTVRQYGIWGTKQAKDEQGEKLTDEEGNPILEPVLRKVSCWNDKKIFRMLSQAQAIKAANR